MEDNTLSGVAPFIRSLWRLVNDDCFDYIFWNEEGTSFIVSDVFRLSRHALPSFFSHGNLTSFVRQLNKYGFRKHPLASGFHYTHPGFLQNCPFLLISIKIKRKESVCEQLSSLKIHIDSVNTRLNQFERESKALFKEVEELKLLFENGSQFKMN